jgi:hypothetical protein
MKFKRGDRVVVRSHLTDNYAGRTGLIAQVWPKVESHGKFQQQYYVCLDGHGQSAIVFNEDQLDFDVLGQMARIK